jgi:hypothetical protein
MFLAPWPLNPSQESINNGASETNYEQFGHPGEAG